MPTKMLFDGSRKLDARPDRIDFRDLPYRSRLVSLPDKYPSDRQIAEWFPRYRPADMVLDQGEESGCPGFGLAGLVNHPRLEIGNVATIESGEKRATERISARM